LKIGKTIWLILVGNMEQHRPAMVMIAPLVTHPLLVPQIYLLYGLRHTKQELLRMMAILKLHSHRVAKRH